jgi:hypothetical protein
MNHSSTFVRVACVLAASALVACEGAQEKPAAGTSTTTIPAGMVARGPAQGTGVTAAKASATQGAEIVIVGKIGGSEAPFSADRAVFTIVDPSLKSCADGGDPDHCTTPWDYCCEDRKALKSGMATIEIAGANGKPLAGSVKGVSGLDPLAIVAVTGTVTERNDAGMLVVRARKIEIR